MSERCGRPWGCPCRHRHERRCTIGNCLVGANALITEGKEFPDNSLIVGTPAKAIRTLDDEAIAKITQSAKKYVGNWQRFARDLERID